MENLVIDGSTSSPRVDFDAARGHLLLSGESYPENSFEFYKPLLNWIRSFLEQSPQEVTLELRLAYLNTSSIKALMDLLDDLEEAHRAGRQVSVNWYYDEENDRALDLAEEFREDLTLPFFIIPTRIGV
ncbi:MAG: hypothetical protein H6Q00_2800 [Holophagaceae bacterium]|nr:hypothetical protein [Holophagaceae bacterium]